MKFKRTLLGLAAIVMLGSTLSGCIVVPGPYGYGGHGGYRYHHDGR